MCVCVFVCVCVCVCVFQILCLPTLLSSLSPSRPVRQSVSVNLDPDLSDPSVLFGATWHDQ